MGFVQVENVVLNFNDHKRNRTENIKMANIITNDF